MTRTAPDPDDQQRLHDDLTRGAAQLERDNAAQRARGPVVNDDPWSTSESLSDSEVPAPHRFRADVIGLADDGVWHGVVATGSLYGDRQAALRQAIKAGHRLARYTEVYLTLEEER